MLNQSAEYALRAVLHMAHQGTGNVYKSTAIADALGLPANYLSKIMHELVRARVMTSERGPTGGYALAVAPAKLSIARVISPFQELSSPSRCLLGDRTCNPRNSCVAHQRWEQLKETLSASLERTTVADMLNPAITNSYTEVS